MKLRAIIALSSAALLTMVFALVSGAGVAPCPVDADSDGICDIADDNCLGVANPDQWDQDKDGYGTACDLDVDNNCINGTADAFITFSNILAAAPWVPLEDGAMDVDANGTVGSSDAFLIFNNLLGSPGPTALVCASCTGAAVGGCP